MANGATELLAEFDQRRQQQASSLGGIGRLGDIGGVKPLSRPRAKIRDFVTQEQIDEPENVLYKILDYMSRGVYVTANVGRAILGTDDLAIGASLLGKKRTSFIDVAKDLGIDGPLGKTLGFVGDVALDPLSWVGIGALTKAGKLAKQAKQFGVKSVKDLDRLATINRKAADELRTAATGGMNVFELGATAAERARLGQQSLGTVGGFFGSGGKSFVNTAVSEKVFKTVSWAAEGIGKTAPARFAKNLFSTKTGVETFDEGRRLAMAQKRLAKGAAYEANANLIRAMEKLIPSEHAEFSFLLEKEKNRGKIISFLKGKGFTEAESIKYISDVRDVNARLAVIEEAAGETYKMVEGDMFYVPHVTTPESRKFLSGKFGLPRSVLEWTNTHASMLERQFKDLPIIEINRRGRAGELVIQGRPLGKLDFDFFDSNPGIAQAIRYQRAASTLVARRFMNEVVETFGTPAGTAPLDFARVNNPFFKDLKGKKVAESFIGEDVVFHPEIARVLDSTMNEIISTGDMNGFLKVVDGFTSLWRAFTVSIVPATWGRDYVSNAFTYGLTGAAKNPGSYSNAWRILNSTKYLGVDASKLIKTEDLFKTFKVPKGKGGVFAIDDPSKLLFDDQTTINLARTHGVLGGRVSVDVEKGLFGLKRVKGKKLPQIVRKRVNPYEQDLIPTIRRGKIFQGGYIIREKFVDDPFRLGLFIDRLQRGFTPGEAAGEVRRWFYDFHDLTRFEQNVMRNVAPFYTWSRRNIPRMIELFMERPGGFAAIWKGKRALERDQIKNDQRFIPKWIKNGMPMQWRRDPQTGDTEYLVFKNWLTVGDMAEVFDPGNLFYNSLTPFLKAPFEMKRNFDGFFQSKIEGFDGEMTQFFGQPTERMTVHVLRNIRILNEANRMMFGKRFKTSDRFRALLPSPKKTARPEREAVKMFFGLKSQERDVESEIRKNIRLYQQRNQPKTRLANLDKLHKIRTDIRKDLENFAR